MEPWQLRRRVPMPGEPGPQHTHPSSLVCCSSHPHPLDLLQTLHKKAVSAERIGCNSPIFVPKDVGLGLQLKG